MKRIRYLTFDATGTLIRPRERIGHTYVDYWKRVTKNSLSSDSQERAETHINCHFPHVFNKWAIKAPNFGRDSICRNHETSAVAESSYSWWKNIILEVFPPVLHVPIEYEKSLTSALFTHYSKGDAWTVFPDVNPVLETLVQPRYGFHLGVISDFDERLPTILEQLHLLHYFDIVTTSWAHGQSKPSPSIFISTFDALGSSPSYSDVLHVGDHKKRDYEGASSVGAQAKWLQRENASKNIDTISTLQQLLTM